MALKGDSLNEDLEKDKEKITYGWIVMESKWVNRAVT